MADERLADHSTADRRESAVGENQRQSDWRPSATLEALQFRAELLRRVREFFDQRGFFEVETPLLSRDVLVDRYLEPVGVPVFEGFPDWCQPEASGILWLQTSPEFAMKRLLAAGAQAIYQVSRAVRAGERGRLHNPEFTLIEWYRVGDDYAAGRELLAEFIEQILGRPKTRQLTYHEAFHAATGEHPWECPLERLEQLVQKLDSPPVGLAHDRDALLQLLFSQHVEPTLRGPEPVIVRDWPAEQAALARLRPGSPPVAERFELFVDGVELANGYHELLDAQELSQRNRKNNQLRASDGRGELPIDSRLLDAMRHGLPQCCGVALGFDRLVMLASGAADISQVTAFDASRA